MASNNFCDSDDDDFGTRPPFFNGDKYYIWKNRMQIFVKGTDFDAWKAIERGPFVPTHIVDGFTKPKPESEWTDDDEKKVHPDSRAKHLISCALCNDEFSYVMYCETAQEMWNTLRNIHEGTGEVKMARIGYLPTMLLVSLFRELEEHDEMYKKIKKNSGRVVASSRNVDEDDSDGSEEVNLVMKDFSKLLKKKKKSFNFKHGEKEHQNKGSSSTRTMF